MLGFIPDDKELTRLLGAGKVSVFRKLCRAIGDLYMTEPVWNSGGKKWMYEYKYRKGGKTLCAFYIRENTLGFMVIFGMAERAEFEAERRNISLFVQRAYDVATTYHDGKWMMLDLSDLSCLDDIGRLLRIKRRPVKK